MAYTTRNGKIVRTERFDASRFINKYWTSGVTHPAQDEAWHKESRKSDRRSRKQK